MRHLRKPLAHPGLSQRRRRNSKNDSVGAIICNSKGDSRIASQAKSFIKGIKRKKKPIRNGKVKGDGNQPGEEQTGSQIVQSMRQKKEVTESASLALKKEKQSRDNHTL